MRFLIAVFALVITTATSAQSPVQTQVQKQIQTPGQAIESALEFNRRALAAQKRIDRLYAERLQLISDTSTIEQDGSVHALHNRETQQQIDQLKTHLVEIDTDLHAVTQTRSGIISLMVGMTDALERFIELDLPFDRDPRLARIQQLRAGLSGAEIDVTKLYQSIVSAYLSEIRLGHSNGVTQQRIETPTGVRMVNVLRMGRAGLWYVTPDGIHAGRWDALSGLWTDTNTDTQMVLSAIRVVQASAKSGRNTQPIALPVQLNIAK